MKTLKDKELHFLQIDFTEKENYFFKKEDVKEAILEFEKIIYNCSGLKEKTHIILTHKKIFGDFEK